MRVKQSSRPTISAVVTRKDGRVEDYGVICGPWHRVLWSRLKRKVKGLKK